MIHHSKSYVLYSTLPVFHNHWESHALKQLQLSAKFLFMRPDPTLCNFIHSQKSKPQESTTSTAANA